eukprot:m.30755 g.30755  ORF g.30755 m.30755 type:complete len:463 (+) comp4812_c0_seq1:212-1600(+)
MATLQAAAGSPASGTVQGAWEGDRCVVRAMSARRSLAVRQEGGGDMESTACGPQIGTWHSRPSATDGHSFAQTKLSLAHAKMAAAGAGARWLCVVVTSKPTLAVNAFVRSGQSCVTAAVVVVPTPTAAPLPTIAVLGSPSLKRPASVFGDPDRPRPRPRGPAPPPPSARASIMSAINVFALPPSSMNVLSLPASANTDAVPRSSAEQAGPVARPRAATLDHLSGITMRQHSAGGVASVRQSARFSSMPLVSFPPPPPKPVRTARALPEIPSASPHNEEATVVGSEPIASPVEGCAPMDTEHHVLAGPTAPQRPEQSANPPAHTPPSYAPPPPPPCSVTPPNSTGGEPESAVRATPAQSEPHPVAPPATKAATWHATPAGHAFLIELIGACALKYPRISVRAEEGSDGRLRVFVGRDDVLIFPTTFPTLPITMTMAPFKYAVRELVPQAVHGLLAVMTLGKKK